MIHRDKTEFKKILENASAATGFPMRLLEKDYYLTVLLGGINAELDENLVFKGGTCLNKIYFEYFRLSEDLDFTMLLPRGKMNKTGRSKTMEKVKKGIKGYVLKFGMTLDDQERPGRNESRQYVYHINYDSIITGTPDQVKFEIGLRANPYLPSEKRKIGHVFKNPFTGEEIFYAGEIECLSLQEIAAEKFRAASTRREIAPRDFFDLDFFIRKSFNFKNKEFIDLAAKKLAEDDFTGSVEKYFKNLNRSKEDIEGMRARLKDELYPVLTAEAVKDFSLDRVLKYFNEM